MRFAPGQGFVRPEDFFDSGTGAFDWLMREARATPKMMSVGLHLRSIGRPGRLRGLELLPDYVTRRPGVWIARHRRALSGLPA
jgi:hypothetical protein